MRMTENRMAARNENELCGEGGMRMTENAEWEWQNTE
jgi:hypothetical protein